MAADYAFVDEDMAIEEGVGYPRAYAKICREHGFGPYSRGPPLTFHPYILQENEILRAKELDQMFPVVDPKAKPTAKPKIYRSLLWKQLNHLGNAGFDPAVIRIDPYGNVLHYRADSASPLAWNIDHWFPCSRGGLTVPSNLRILQWQACKNKQNKLEFLVPWWDLQVGVSVNQFLSIFAASNSDFRRRAFSFLFKEGENEELNGSQSVESHRFPQHFYESKEKFGLAPAAVVVSRRDSYDSSILRSMDYNRQIVASRKIKPSGSKENENPDFVTNPYQAIVAARDALKQREEAQNMRAEIKKLDAELNETIRKNDDERLTIQELELALIKRRRRAEKSRRLGEAQSSYRSMLEKMIRDAMHQSVVYKEQVRLNQAATSALMARLEAQKAICDASEKELHKKYKERDELEKQIRPESEQARKRSRLEDDSSSEDRDDKIVLRLPEMSAQTSLHKELRVFLEEEQKVSKAEAESTIKEEGQQEGEIEEEQENPAEGKSREHEKSVGLLEDKKSVEDRLRRLEIAEGKRNSFMFPVPREQEGEEDEESRRERGKGNVEKWLQILLENNDQEGSDLHIENDNKARRKEDIIEKLNEKYPLKQTDDNDSKADNYSNKEILETQAKQTAREIDNACEVIGGGIGSRKSFDEKKTGENKGKEKALKRSESARAFRRIPSSPTLLLKKGVDCIRKKPMVTGDDDDNEYLARNNFIMSSINTIKRAVKF